MGMSAQQLLAQDPEYLSRQLAQQEIQRYQNFQNPQLGLAATSGAVLGRGLANLFGGRGFFEVSDPALRRVADTQRVFNEAMTNFDPANPAASYEAMARRFSELGFGQQAMMAAQEAAKYRQQERAESRAVSAEQRAQSGERRAAYQFNPQLAIEDAGKLPEDDPQRTTLLTLASRLLSKESFDIAVKNAQINASEADAIYKKALAGKAEKETDMPRKVWERAGIDTLGNVTLFNPYTGETKVLKGTLSDTPGAAPAKPTGERKPLGSFESGASQPAGVPEVAASSMNTRYIRSKGRGNTYVYTPSPRGLTMEEWRQRDSE